MSTKPDRQDMQDFADMIIELSDAVASIDGTLNMLYDQEVIEGEQAEDADRISRDMMHLCNDLWDLHAQLAGYNTQHGPDIPDDYPLTAA